MSPILKLFNVLSSTGVINEMFNLSTIALNTFVHRDSKSGRTTGT